MDENRQKSRFSEHNSPFYRPLWRRVAITAVVALWLGFEIYFQGDSLWIAIAAVALCYALWIFFLSWPKTPDNPPQ
jgi:hypothetical protein